MSLPKSEIVAIALLSQALYCQRLSIGKWRLQEKSGKVIENQGAFLWSGKLYVVKAKSGNFVILLMFRRSCPLS